MFGRSAPVEFGVASRSSVSSAIAGVPAKCHCQCGACPSDVFTGLVHSSFPLIKLIRDLIAQSVTNNSLLQDPMRILIAVFDSTS